MKKKLIWYRIKFKNGKLGYCLDKKTAINLKNGLYTGGMKGELKILKRTPAGFGK